MPPPAIGEDPGPTIVFAPPPPPSSVPPTDATGVAETLVGAPLLGGCWTGGMRFDEAEDWLPTGEGGGNGVELEVEDSFISEPAPPPPMEPTEGFFFFPERVSICAATTRTSAPPGP